MAINKRKKIKSVQVVMVMLFLQLTGCGFTQSSPHDVDTMPLTVNEGQNQENTANSMVSQNDVDAAVQHLLVVWSDYLSVLDKMYASELWALDYVEDYLESGDWEDLSKARTACIASARYLTELSMAEEDLSQEEYQILSKAGIDVGYQSECFLSLADDLEYAYMVIRDDYLENLEGGVFYENIVENMKENIVLQRELIACDCQYICCETNYLLLTLGDDAMARKYWYSMEEKYPVLSTECGIWPGTEAKLKAEATASMDKENEISLKMEELVSELSAELEEMTQIAMKGDIKKLKSYAYEMSNMPDLLPMPVWYEPETAGYLSFILLENGSIEYPQIGDELKDANYGVYMQVEDVSRKEVEDYIAYVEKYVKAVQKEENDVVWNILVSDYAVGIEWKDNVVTVIFNGEDVTFAPYWYVE